MDLNTILANTQAYVQKFMQDHEHQELTYHNLDHTQTVVTAVALIGRNSNCSDEDIQKLQIAAWFHDIGYFYNQVKNHESIGAEKASEYIISQGGNPELAAEIKVLILATQMPQTPTNLLQNVICDADLYHLSNPNFYEKTKKLRKEIEKQKGIKISKKDWYAKTIEFMNGHEYFTDFGKKVLTPMVKENVAILEKKIKEEEKENPKEEKDEHKIIVKKEKVKPGKGIETMFRITSGNNQKLSDMADNKAHILITVNSIILSAILSLMLKKLDTYMYLSIPVYLTLSVSVITIIFSILATRPNLPSGYFTKQDVQNKEVNLLFFGNFYRMSLQDYTEGMQSVMNDYDYLYNTLIKDVYSQGIVLSHKYKLLRIAYSFFMFGLIVSVISFMIATIFYGTPNLAQS